MLCIWTHETATAQGLIYESPCNVLKAEGCLSSFFHIHTAACTMKLKC